jgi:hypothetical protein
LEITAVSGAKLLGEGYGYSELGPAIAIPGSVHGDQRGGVVITVGRVEGEFVPDPQADKDRDGHTDSQAGDVDKRIDFAPDEMAPGYGKIVFQHRLRLCEFLFQTDAKEMAGC